MVEFTDYKTAMDWLYRQLPMFQRQGAAAFKKDLTNTIALCSFLGNPERQFPCIHIAGTNGKGTAAHLIGAALQANGLKVGLYTSPHYKDFRERIKINGKLVGRRFVLDFLHRSREAAERIQPSFFEWSFAMAMDYFAQENVDIAVIETGLGGRLDSTNVVTPLLSVITNISYDHMEFLGNTLPEIAYEKAGIIKYQVPVVIGEEQPEVRTVFENKAADMQAPISFASKRWMARLVSEETGAYMDLAIGEHEEPWGQIRVGLSGSYQIANVLTALESFRVLRSLEHWHWLSWERLTAGWEHLRDLTRMMGRWQKLQDSPTVIVDSAHNEGGIHWVVKMLDGLPHQHLHIVFGAVKDKDLSKMLQLLPADAAYYWCKADIPRGLDAASLQSQAATFGLKGRAYSSVKNAFKAAKRRARPEDLVFVGGSIFVVAEVI